MDAPNTTAHGPDDGDVGPGTGTVRHRRQYTVIVREHQERILAHSREHRCPALLALYLVMASKPDGWRFSATRLGHEIGAGRESVERLLRHLATLGYYRAERQADEHGLWRTRTVFDPEGSVGHLPDALGTPDDPVSPGRTDAWSPSTGDRGTGDQASQSVLTPSTESQSVGAASSAHEATPPTHDDDDDWTDLEGGEGPQDVVVFADAVVEALGPDAPATSTVLREALAVWQSAGWAPSDVAANLTEDMSAAVRSRPSLVRARILRGPHDPGVVQRTADGRTAQLRLHHPVRTVLDESQACDHGEPRGPAACALCRVGLIAVSA